MAHDLVQAMKDGMRRLVSGVSVISTFGADGQGFAMTVSSVTSVSDAPPSLLVCINQSTRIAPVLSIGQRFAVNVLGQSHQDVSIQCSTGEQNEKRLQTGNWCLDAGQIPYLKDAEAVFECVVDQSIPYGSHDIVVGKIVLVRMDKKSAAPLVYANGGYCGISTT